MVRTQQHYVLSTYLMMETSHVHKSGEWEDLNRSEIRGTMTCILKPCIWNSIFPCLVGATGTGDLPAVWVWTATMGWFGSSPVQCPNQLPHGRPNPGPYPPTLGFCRVWLDPSVPTAGSVFQVPQLITALRYDAVNRKISTLVRCCLFLMC